MNTASAFTVALFVLTVAVVAWLFVRAARRALAPPTSTWLIVAVIVGGIVVPGALSAGHLLDRYTPLPAPGLALVGIIAVLTVALAFSRIGTQFIAGISLAALVGYQAFRIPVEFALHRLYLEAAIPVQMTYEGRNFDIVTGVAAVVLAALLRRGRVPTSLVLIWNVMGLALLVNIVTVAVLSTPTPFRQFMNEPANLLPSAFPFVWLPDFLVPAALFGHLLVFRAIAARAK